MSAVGMVLDLHGLQGMSLIVLKRTRQRVNKGGLFAC